MKTNRRQFISTAAAAGLAASLPLASCKEIDSDYEKLDLILKQPVFKKEVFTSPVIIASIELLRYENNFICRVRSKDGAVGLSVGHGSLRNLYPIFTNLVQPFFMNKDARDLDLIMEKIFI